MSETNARIEGFIVGDTGRSRHPRFHAAMRGHMVAGRPSRTVDVVHGRAGAPQAFIGLLEGRDVGKLVVALD